ncbi:S8 family serine peptidase [Chitinophaga sancti]|uniref:S8 family serine peptidase n=1 Tax=Chitinophaga sancti TaxID=1004 RepID=A0A1K1LRH7_9BACT|nr:S8 family serine peptidase [Chitinophaga sancti]WQD64903.1 S8 family serine peptidase [Chitinophaga sancti]WQG89473.1 S8 family serine peptidase [Chitinophaga sancti]SFW13467.1 hypothetical protein SAMN05661012_00159 [Chitinophaga sancti]
MPVVAIIDEGVLMDRVSGIREVNIYESAAGNINDSNVFHGTNIAHVIRQVYPAADLLSVRMVPDDKINVPLLCKALRYCATQDDVRIINISLGILGTENPSAELLECCLECHQQGKLLVAAAHFDCSKLCYPAAYPFVYGVGAGLIQEIDRYVYIGDSYITVLAKGVHQRLLYDHDRQVIRGGTSYAAAAFSGILCRRLATSEVVAIEDAGVEALSLHYQSNRSPVGNNYLTWSNEDYKIVSYASHLEAVKGVPVLFNMSFFVPEMHVVPGVPALKPVLSPKLFDHVDTLLLGNFFNTRSLLNVYFGYALINYFIINNGKFLVLDPYIASVIRKSIFLSKVAFSGQIVLLETHT